MTSILTMEHAFGRLREPRYLSESSTTTILLSCFVTGFAFIFFRKKLDITDWVSILLSAIITLGLIIRYWVYYYGTTNSPLSGIFKNLTPAITAIQYLLDIAIVLLIGLSVVLMFAILLVGWFAYQMWLALLGSAYALTYLRCASTFRMLESGEYEQLVPSLKNSDTTTKKQVNEIFSHWKIGIPIYSGLYYSALFLSFFDASRHLSLAVTAFIGIYYYVIKFRMGRDPLTDFGAKIMRARNP